MRDFQTNYLLKDYDKATRQLARYYNQLIIKKPKNLWGGHDSSPGPQAATEYYEHLTEFHDKFKDIYAVFIAEPSLDAEKEADVLASIYNRLKKIKFFLEAEFNLAAKDIKTAAKRPESINYTKNDRTFSRELSMHGIATTKGEFSLDQRQKHFDNVRYIYDRLLFLRAVLENPAFAHLSQTVEATNINSIVDIMELHFYDVLIDSQAHPPKDLLNRLFFFLQKQDRIHYDDVVRQRISKGKSPIKSRQSSPSPTTASPSKSSPTALDKKPARKRLKGSTSYENMLAATPTPQQQKSPQPYLKDCKGQKNSSSYENVYTATSQPRASSLSPVNKRLTFIRQRSASIIGTTSKTISSTPRPISLSNLTSRNSKSVSSFANTKLVEPQPKPSSSGRRLSLTNSKSSPGLTSTTVKQQSPANNMKRLKLRRSRSASGPPRTFLAHIVMERLQREQSQSTIEWHPVPPGLEPYAVYSTLEEQNEVEKKILNARSLSVQDQRNVLKTILKEKKFPALAELYTRYRNTHRAETKLKLSALEALLLRPELISFWADVLSKKISLRPFSPRAKLNRHRLTSQQDSEPDGIHVFHLLVGNFYVRSILTRRYAIIASINAKIAIVKDEFQAALRQFESQWEWFKPQTAVDFECQKVINKLLVKLKNIFNSTNANCANEAETVFQEIENKIKLLEKEQERDLDFAMQYKEYTAYHTAYKHDLDTLNLMTHDATIVKPSGEKEIEAIIQRMESRTKEFEQTHGPFALLATALTHFSVGRKLTDIIEQLSKLKPNYSPTCALTSSKDLLFSERRIRLTWLQDECRKVSQKQFAKALTKMREAIKQLNSGEYKALIENATRRDYSKMTEDDKFTLDGCKFDSLEAINKWIINEILKSDFKCTISNEESRLQNGGLLQRKTK